MTSWIGRCLLMVIVLSACQGFAAVGEAQLQAFDTLVNEAELVFAAPEGFADIAPRTNAVLNYERALRSQDARLEIRYAVRPIKRLRIDYDDPHGSVPDPNHIFPLMFESIASRLGAGGHTPSREYSSEQARELFNADWAAAAVFDVNPEFQSSHSQGLVIALHRNRVADAYVVFLFDDYALIKPRLNHLLQALAYR